MTMNERKIWLKGYLSFYTYLSTGKFIENPYKEETLENKIWNDGQIKHLAEFIAMMPELDGRFVNLIMEDDA